MLEIEDLSAVLTVLPAALMNAQTATACSDYAEGQSDVAAVPLLQIPDQTRGGVRNLQYHVGDWSVAQASPLRTEANVATEPLVATTT